MEPREVAHFELEDLLSGGTGVVGRLGWFAHAPHLPAPVEVDPAHVPLLGALGAVDWVPRASLDAQYGPAAVDALLHAGLLIARSQDDTSALADDAFRAVRWHAPAAVAHAASRWQGEDGPRAMAEAGVDTSAGLVREQGTPPPHVPAQRSQGAATKLPRIGHDEFDRLLDTRATCRNYDLSATLPLATVSQLLARVFGARGGDDHVGARSEPQGVAAPGLVAMPLRSGLQPRALVVIGCQAADRGTWRTKPRR